MSDFVFDPKILNEALVKIKQYSHEIASAHVASMGYDPATTVGQKMTEAYTAGYDKAMKDGFRFFENIK